MEEWKRLTDAAREVGISAAKLSGWVKRGRVPSKKDPFDERATLVDMTTLRRILGISPKEA